jgi:cytochrome bd-type quinol oxidase subunit 1
MRTQEAVTPMPKIAIPFVIFTLIYVFLSVALFFLLRRQFMKTDAPASKLVTKNV